MTTMDTLLTGGNAKEAFKLQIEADQAVVNNEVASYCQQDRARLPGDPAHDQIAGEAILSILERPCSRIRGVLVMHGYRMAGGQNEAISAKAGSLLEVIHGDLLVTDDIQDHSEERRGGKAAHVIVAEQLRLTYPSVTDEAITETVRNEARAQGHRALGSLSSLTGASLEARIKVMTIMHKTLALTGPGQNADIMNPFKPDLDEADILRMMNMKTAYYSFLNPLQVGMALADADQKHLDAIVGPALEIGTAYQLVDDLAIMNPDSSKKGKNPLDDLAGGKRTLLMHYALNSEDTTPAGKIHLEEMLTGKRELSDPVNVDLCRDILTTSGAVKYTKDQAAGLINSALSSLDQHADLWSPDTISFMRQLALKFLPK
jgi:geranylgeranyl diphosphate synthase type I